MKGAADLAFSQYQLDHSITLIDIAPVLRAAAITPLFVGKKATGFFRTEKVILMLDDMEQEIEGADA